MFSVVIIDDEYFFRNSLKCNMPWQENDMKVIGDANDGSAGLNLILEARPDIVIIDINMPIYSGLEVIRRSLAAGVSSRFIILTGYDEFEYAKTALELNVGSYILKPVVFSELLEALNREKKRIEQTRREMDAFNQLRLNSELYQLDRDFAAMANHRLPVTEQRRFLDSLPRFEHYRVMLYESSEPFESIIWKIRLRLAEQPFAARCVTAMDSAGLLVIILDGETPEDAERFHAELTALFPDFFSNCRRGMGRAYDRPEDIVLSYYEARMACLQFGSDSAFRADTSENQIMRATLSLERQEALRTCIEQLDGDKTRQILSDIFNPLRNQNVSYENIIVISLSLISLLESSLSRNNSAPIHYPGNGEGLLSHLEGFRSVDDFHAWVEALYLEGIRQISSARPQYSSITGRVIRYVDENLGDPDISVKRISDDLFVNYSHLCVTFKRDMNITVNEYILQQRMSRAMEMFRSGISSISYVAEKVGFEDAGYFSKCFRKRFSITPSHYIQNLQARNAGETAKQ